MATVPTPFDATAAQKLTATQWDAQVRDVLLWLMGNGASGVYPRVHAYDNTGNACTTGVAKLLLYDSEVYDTDSMHSTVTNTSRITFTTTGLYRVNTQVVFPTATFANPSWLQARINSGGSVAGGTSLFTKFFNVAAAATANPNIIFNKFFTAGDHIEMFALQASGGASTTSTTTNLYTHCQADWIAVQ